MQKPMILEITPHRPTGDEYSVSSYPGPGVYLTALNLIFVGNGTYYSVPINALPRLEQKPDPLPPPPPAPPPGVSEATLLKAIAIVAAPTKIGDLTF